MGVANPYSEEPVERFRKGKVFTQQLQGKCTLVRAGPDLRSKIGL